MWKFCCRLRIYTRSRKPIIELHVKRPSIAILFYSILWMSYLVFITRVIVGNLFPPTLRSWRREAGVRGSRDMVPLHFRGFLSYAALCLLAFGCVHVPEEEQFKAEGFTEPGLFTDGIEGPACDREGNVYVVNFGDQGTIGRVAPDGKAELFVRLPEGSIGNGIVFDRAGRMFVADYTRHNVLGIDLRTREIEVVVHEPGMNQPNDLAIAPDGTLYASDPSWKIGTGQLWRIDRKKGSAAKATLLARDLGTTNGIEVSPDGKTLYVNESVQRKVWAWTITKDELTDKRLVREFADFGFDGMRCDVDGNLYITRHGKGTVVKMLPGGEILREVDVLGAKPSNLCFGGPDGRTVYVTEVEHRRLVKFRVDRPGLAWSRWK